jgi:2-hydroxychromene-2-carboxylate isomerase
MKHITFYLDFISPYAYLAFERLPQALQGLSYTVTYRPILFAALLKHHGQLGPAEIPAKRDWTYRQVQWLAHSQGVPLAMPASHPFNPLNLLRLAVACAETDAEPSFRPGAPNRYVIETLFRHVWQGGGDVADAARFAVLVKLLHPAVDIASDAVKARLKSNTDEAIAKSVFGVPSFEVDGKVFWGQDALPMLAAYLQGDTWFAGPAWDTAAQVPVGVARARSNA